MERIINYPFNLASQLIKDRYNERVQKVSIDFANKCPNRDGTLSNEGCYYCSTESYLPYYVRNNQDYINQLNEGISYYKKRYKCNRFFAFLQASSNTYMSAKKLETIINKLLEHTCIEGIVIATRPDCLEKDKLQLLQKIAKQTYIRLEIGIESFCDEALSFANRCHDSQTGKNALIKAAEHGIETCAHLILGLPPESIESQLKTAFILNECNIKFLKLHHLQIVKNSKFEQIYKNSPEKFNLYSKEQYLDIVAQFLTHLSKEIYIDRFINKVPLNQLIAPLWNNVSEQSFQSDLAQYMQTKNLTQSCGL